MSRVCLSFLRALASHTLCIRYDFLYSVCDVVQVVIAECITQVIASVFSFLSPARDL